MGSLESLQQMAVKLYEKDPSKLTAEPLPTLSNIDDDEDEDDDEEDSNQAADIKEEPVDVTTVDENPPPIVPDTSQAVWAATAFPTPHLLTSGQEDPSTDSDTETGHALKCRHCSSTASSTTTPPNPLLHTSISSVAFAELLSRTR